MPALRTRDGIRLFYESFAPKGSWTAPTTALLIMGLGMRGRVWGETTLRLRKRGHAVLTMDNRGVGHSQTPTSPWSTATMADDAVQVLDAAGVERAHVVGVSLGGMVAQQVVLRHPARVAALALISTSGGLPRLDFVPPGTVLGLLGMAFGGRGASAEQRMREALALLASEDYAREADLRDPRVRELLVAMGDGLSPRGYMLQMMAAGTHGTWDRLGEIRVPTLVQHGAEDRVVAAGAGRELARRIRGARLEVYPGAGHLLALQRPDSIESLASFLDQPNRGSTSRS